MIILYGTRNVWPKIVAYRNDFCVSCDAPRRAHLIRSLKTFHLFFIPVLPLALVRQWRCSVCERHPHKMPRQRYGWKLALTYVLGVLALIVWVSSNAETGNSVDVTWLLRIGFTIGFVAMLWYALRSRFDFHLKEKLGAVEAAQETNCPFCESQFILDRGWRCSQCGVERVALSL